jgi:putative phosphoribosyl transferase
MSASRAQHRRFQDRRDAGRKLAGVLRASRTAPPLVLGLARGGIVVADEVAKALGAPLDVMVVRKVGAPAQPEMAVGALAPDVLVLDPRVDRDHPQIRERIQAETVELYRRLRRYRGVEAEPEVAGRDVILVDDGLATGRTARAAVRALRGGGARHITLAVPVGAPDAVDELEADVDVLVCLYQPASFFAVGEWYDHFTPVSDDEVVRILSAAQQRSTEAGTEPGE